ncbi:MAG TPA: hypothetical protein VIF62_25095 [Labilithrix sp.]|jgi:hypothetical protein
MGLGRASIVVLAFAGACSTYAPHEPDGDAGVNADAGGDDAGATDAAEASDAADGAATDAPTDGDAGCPSCKRYVFVTSLQQFGNVGIAGADAFCMGRASVAPGTVLSGRTFVAWLSSSTSNVSSRLTHGTGPYVRVDEVTVARDYAELTSGMLESPIDIDETGTPLAAGSLTWTGTTTGGTVAAATCNDWTTPAANGVTGDSSLTTGSWTTSGQASCASSQHLYCIEK